MTQSGHVDPLEIVNDLLEGNIFVAKKSMLAILILAPNLAVAQEVPTLASHSQTEYRLVSDWPTIPAGMHLGHSFDFPLPDVRATQEKARNEAIARGETPPPWHPAVEPGISGVTIDKHDQIFVFNRGEHPVIVLDPNGQVIRTGAIGITGEVPHFIKIDREENVWVADEGAHRVLKLDPEMKKILLEIGVKDEAGYDSAHLDSPADVAITSKGEILIADGYGNNRITKYTPEGRYLDQWGGGPEDTGTGPGEFDLPHAILVDSKDRVYVLDRENYRIQMFDTDGTFQGQLDGLGYIWGIALSPDERHMFMTEHESEQVLKVSLPDGEIVSRWGGPGRGPGEFDWAHGLAVDSHGAVYVGDTYGQRLQKFVPEGTATER